ncbi:MAG: tetratricopeptide repeat protein, partial [Candidatus Zophobacter franzmannii]|nr:tetratricopeptide repeat protein [Candidatus Zophobacter franzmannii]
MKIEEIQNKIQTIMSCFEEEDIEILKSDFLIYFTFLSGVDNKFSRKELIFINKVMETKHKNLKDMYAIINWEDYVKNPPRTLLTLVKSDLEQGFRHENGVAKLYISILYKLGDALLNVDGKTSAEDEAMGDYISFLERYSMSKFIENTKSKDKPVLEVDFPELQNKIQTVLVWFEGAEKGIIDNVKTSFILYLVYFAGLGKKISNKEIKFINNVTGNNLDHIQNGYAKIDWSDFLNKVPSLTLSTLVDSDKIKDLSYDEGLAKRYISILYDLGDALLNVSGKTFDEDEAMKDYLSFLEQYSMSKLEENTKSVENPLLELDFSELLAEAEAFYKNEEYEKSFIIYESLSRFGDAYAQFSLGFCYQTGQGVEKDLNEAFKWYLKAAELEFADAQYLLGYCYQNGQGVEADIDEAFKWYLKSVENGSSRGMYYLGSCYQDGQGVEADIDEALKWYLKAAENGECRGMYKVGLCYQNGDGVEEDLDEAIKWYLKAAENGDDDAPASLDETADAFYENEEYEKAVPLYQKAADLGNNYSQYSLGMCYEFGQGVEADIDEAFKWYLKAAENGNDEAPASLSEIADTFYENEEYEKAVPLYQKAADFDDAYAQYSLGVCSQNGEGVEEDLDEATKWYLKAAENGNDEARTTLAEIAYFFYSNKEVEKAAPLFQIVAELGDAYAQSVLGQLYQNGIGVEEDLGEAIKWYLSAANNGIDRVIYPLAFSYFVNREFKNSFEWFEKSRDIGIDDAWYYLGWLYFTGEGTECDKMKAKECWSKVIAPTQADFQFRIGHLYNMNSYPKEALYWLTKAKEHGNEDAVELLSKLVLGKNLPDAKSED